MKFLIIIVLLCVYTNGDKEYVDPQQQQTDTISEQNEAPIGRLKFIFSREFTKYFHLEIRLEESLENLWYLFKNSIDQNSNINRTQLYSLIEISLK
jgi:hypothetical protein